MRLLHHLNLKTKYGWHCISNSKHLLTAKDSALSMLNQVWFLPHQASDNQNLQGFFHSLLFGLGPSLVHLSVSLEPTKATSQIPALGPVLNPLHLGAHSVLQKPLLWTLQVCISSPGFSVNPCSDYKLTPIPNMTCGQGDVFCCNLSSFGWGVRHLLFALGPLIARFGYNFN